MNKIIIANWKANPKTLAEAQELFDFSANEAAKYPSTKTIICPPQNFLKELQVTSYKLQGLLGAQDVFWSQASEAPREIKYVLVGHSDRRKAGDTDEIVNQKLKNVLGAGITPVLLVGERVRSEGVGEILEKQLAGGLAGLSTAQIGNILICYEPVWAISRPSADIALFVETDTPDIVCGPTGPILNSDTPENALEAIKIIKDFLRYKLQAVNCKYLYGGSVTSDNVADFLRHLEISGAVIGGASLKKEEFGNILKIVSQIQL